MLNISKSREQLIVYEILAEFDFHKIHKVMDLLDWEFNKKILTPEYAESSPLPQTQEPGTVVALKG